MKKVLYILFHRSVLVALSLLAQVVTLVVLWPMMMMVGILLMYCTTSVVGKMDL